MDAEMYGITPRAKMEALPNAPPENMFRRPTRPSEVLCWKRASIEGSMPGRTTKHPNLYTSTRIRV